MRPAITRGRPWPFVDALTRFLSLPNKLLFLNARFENHHLDPDVEAAVLDFIDHHQPDGVHVRLNE